ncbi:hypothetical protein P245_22995 [Comamonas thiooxydans]|uniref:Uncharacterized protein n=1 Tax=Comamonas thiooxydans TaxID=363952 RepID=A0A0E3BAU7_9BURK|nr:hypothetical protein P245_22995 [Comamonas thiooxydans]
MLSDLAQAGCCILTIYGVKRQTIPLKVHFKTAQQESLMKSADSSFLQKALIMKAFLRFLSLSYLQQKG